MVYNKGIVDRVATLDTTQRTPDRVPGDSGCDAAAIRWALRVRHSMPWLAMRRTEHGGVARDGGGCCLSGRLGGCAGSADSAFRTTSGRDQSRGVPVPRLYADLPEVSTRLG
jgi:hypothetical protein